MNRILKRNSKSSSENKPRTFSIGNPEVSQSNFPTNQLHSAPYPSTIHLITFGFWDLVCSSVASIYFAIVGLLQILTPFSPTGKFATLLPYLGNKLIELFFVWRSNAKRILSDHLINSRPVRVLRNDGVMRITRSEIVVGDILLLEAEWRDEEVPVDLILLSSATDVFLSLASLTGEKDPVRKVPVAGLSVSQVLSEEHKNIYGICTSPGHHDHLDNFSAEIRLGTDRFRVTADSFLPSGSTLLHGSEIYGLVHATGRDCKIALSNPSQHHRRFNLLDSRLNVLTQITLALLVLFIFLGSAGKLMSTDQVTLSDALPVVILYFLLFNGLIAQTLQFSLTLVRGYQGESIPEDDKNNIGSLEQMCLCDAVVFDKTGTLTANILQPKFIGLPELNTSLLLAPSHLSSSSTTSTTNLSSSVSSSSSLSSSLSSSSSSSSSLSSDSHSLIDQKLTSKVDIDPRSLLSRQPSSISSFYRPNLIENGLCRFYGAESHSDSKLKKIHYHDITVELHNMFIAILLNNSVMPRPSRRQLEFFGTSSDEVALLDTVHRFSDYSFTRTMLSNGEDELRIASPSHADAIWHIIHVFKYTSKKGKMSVLARRQSDNQVFLIVKGSPSRVLPLVDPVFHARAHQLVSSLASSGLRILMFAWKRLPDWDTHLCADFESRKNADDATVLDELLPAIELDMQFLGVTGTEDNLHPLVDHTIQRFQASGIKTLLCTGDIRETALNIGINSAILPDVLKDPSARVFNLSIDAAEDLHAQLQSALAYVSAGDGSGPIGVVVGNAEVPIILGSDHLCGLFVEIIAAAQGVVIARADPEMKLAITRFLMHKCRYLTMAVGDGANDIPMLQAAHVSVGIKSGENQNAAAASDLAIRVVTDLPHRVFELSPMFWRRNAKIPKFISSMKLTVILTLLIFDIFNGFEGKSMFTGTQLLFFNAFYGWSVLVYGISYHNPSLSRHREALLQEVNPLVIFQWIGKTLFDTLFSFSLSSFWFDHAPSIQFFGDLISPQSFANWILLVAITNLRVSLDVGVSIKRLIDHKYIHCSVVATIFVFLLVTIVPRLLQIPFVFILKLFLILVVFILLDSFLSWIFFQQNETASTSIQEKDE